MSKLKKVSDQKVIRRQYDPTKIYEWDANAEVAISGLEYNIVYNMLQAELSTPEAQKIIEKYHLHQKLVQVLQREVEAGRFREKE